MIDILLATYNGEKYIEVQLYSLLAQTHKEWRLLIHDDGSMDNTVQIIKRFQALDDRIILIEDGIKCGGAGANFLHLLKHSDADYTIFCDQDDIWLENKLDVMYKRIHSEKEPCAVYSNGFLYRDEIILRKNVEFHRKDVQNSLFLNGGIHGCCLMFNKKLISIVKDNMPQYVYMHDHLVTILAVTFGKLIYIDKVLMLYRQHDANVTGNIPTSFGSRLKTFLSKENSVIEKRHYKANVAFFEALRHKMSDSQSMLFQAYIEYPNVNIFKRIKIVLKNRFKSGSIFALLLKTFLRKPI